MIDLSTIESYTPEADVRDFLLLSYNDFEKCRNLVQAPQEIMGGLTLGQFWDKSNFDYNVLTEESDINDPVKSYSSSISRDKSNGFISVLTNQLILPSVTAQNSEQEIDNTISKVARSVLTWAHMNDGRPSSSGHKKTVGYVHKMVVEGTVHVQDDVVDGRLVSSLVPNDQIYIPNFWQNDLQLQPFLFRVQEQIHYDEAKRLFGMLDTWKYVTPGDYSGWNRNNLVLFKDNENGVTENDEVQIIYMWRDIDKTEFTKYRVPKRRSKAKLFNAMINGVLMFPPDNLMPYHDGFYPITKEIFELFSKSEYYWGNSMPNKATKDKDFLDGWKTLIRHKAKIASIPPILTFNGQYLDSSIFVPGTVNQAPSGMKPTDIMEVPGINLDGVSQSDIAVLQDAKDEIDQGNISSQATGKQTRGIGTATEAILLEQNEQKILGAFGLRVAFLIEGRTFPILKRLFQFLPKSDVKKIAVPEQSLGDGKTGTLEVVFEKLPRMDEGVKMAISKNIRAEELKAEESGQPKKILFIDPSYANTLDLYVTATAETKPRPTDAIRRAEAKEKFDTYSSRPDMFNNKAVARNFVRANGDDEVDLLNTNRPGEEQPQPGGEAGETEGQERLKGAVGARKRAVKATREPASVNI